MNRDSTFKEISNRLLQLLPLAGNLKSQMQSKINSALKSAFEEFGVITKDELEQERIALERAMIRIAELEKHLDSLESELKKKN
tara:strand:- start:630 stop:881 length:252 start_codon:yes stop_codon:yes gene_type:complete